jgi:hypothetical protein
MKRILTILWIELCLWLELSRRAGEPLTKLSAAYGTITSWPFFTRAIERIGHWRRLNQENQYGFTHQ